MEAVMCEVIELNNGSVHVNHNYADYICQHCGETWCWECNVDDHRHMHSGEGIDITCPKCKKVIFSN